MTFTVPKNKLEKIEAFLLGHSHAYVSFSGGVDSAVLLKIAHDILGDKVTAITFNSPTLTENELNEAKKLADLIGARHEVVTVNELNNTVFVSNPQDRCYHCKKLRFAALEKIIELDLGRIDIKTNTSESGINAGKITEKENLEKPRTLRTQIIDGTNADDLNDWRPGLAAAKESGIRSPFAESCIGKAEIRSLAYKYHLPNWNKPSSACLASRVPYGNSITEEKLQQIEKAEAFLRNLGFKQVRVRHHGSVARIELSKNKIKHAIIRSDEITEEIKSLGFYFVALDLAGFKSGSMNSMLE